MAGGEQIPVRRDIEPHGCLPPSVSDDGTRAVVVSLSANLASDASLAVLTENLRLLDDRMCSGR